MLLFGSIAPQHPRRSPNNDAHSGLRRNETSGLAGTLPLNRQHVQVRCGALLLRSKEKPEYQAVRDKQGWHYHRWNEERGA
jgi:hypothetical protein